MTNKRAPDRVEGARAEVLRLRDRDIEIWHERQQIVAGLHDLEAKTGRQVADGGNADAAARQLAEGEARLRVQDRAADEVTRQRETAVPSIWRAQAASERASEAAKRDEAKKIEARARPLLDQLRELQGCEYAPAGRQPGDGGPSMGGTIVYSLANSQRLLAESNDHASKAAILDVKAFNPNAGGQVSAKSIDELVVLGLGDGQHAFPALRDVERWALEAEQKGRQRLRGIRDGYAGATPDPDTSPPTWTLTWRGHDVVPGESRVSFLGLSGSTPADDYFGDRGLEQVGERSWIRPDTPADLEKLGPLADDAQADRSGDPYRVAAGES